MGVVRREGQWRLLKREEGLYEVTYRREPQVKVVTPDYSPGMGDDVSLSPIPVHEVSSYAEAEGIFEEHAHRGQPAGVASFGSAGSSPGSSVGGGDLGLGFGDGDGLDDDAFIEDAEKLPPGGIALALLLVGGVILSISGLAPGEPTFLVGAGLAGLGVAIVAWALILFRTKGWREAVDFLITVDREEQPGTGDPRDSEDESSTTPPAPEKLKNELIFGRAGQECEWCGDHLDNPEVHHIEPRNEGGPNDPENLIVLCPTCHRKADQGGISRTKLRGKLSHILKE